ncbi:MAG: folate-binding protein YgfZ, partial [Gemmataceae bacterium]
RTADFSLFHVAGPQAATALTKLAALPALEPWRQAKVELGSMPVSVRRLDRFALTGYDLLVPRDQAETLTKALQEAGIPIVSAETQEILRIEAGWPREGIDMDENNLVMELGGAQQAISFNKGCFLGQEPIVRARDLGHVNWGFRGLRVQGDQPVLVGSKLYQGEKDVGRITSSAVSPTLGSIALGYVRRGSHGPGTELAVDTPTGHTTAVVSGLPFFG